MDTVVYVISILMWILCPALIGLILLQGAAGDISSAFGGGGQLDASLGVGAHRKMAQATGVLAALFFIMVLLMAYPHRDSYDGVKRAPAPAVVPAPTTPAAAQPAAPAVVPAAPAAPVVVTPEVAAPAVAQPEAAKAVETQPVTVPAVVPEAAKAAETAPVTVPAVVPEPAAPPKP